MRGSLTAYINARLIAGEAYADILAAVRVDYPEAETSARSLASMATALRKKGLEIAPRGAAASTVENPLQGRVEQLEDEVGDLMAKVAALEALVGKMMKVGA